MGSAGIASIQNPPLGALIFERNPGRFLEFTVNGWGTRLIGIPGGGTGSLDAAGARANLGIGTMGVQNSNAVSITGGIVFGLTQLDLGCPIRFINDGVYDLGSPTGAVRNLYIRHGLVVPCGVNKYVSV